MAITSEPVVLFTEAFFVPNGTAFTLPTPGTASATAKPGSEDTSWDAGALGDIEEFKDDTKLEKIEKVAPRAGGLRVVDQAITSAKKTFTFKTQDRTPLVETLVNACDTLDGTDTTATPMGATGQLKGWLRLKTKNSEGTLLKTTEHFVALSVNGIEPQSGKNWFQVELEAVVLHSSSAAVTFAT